MRVSDEDKEIRRRWWQIIWRTGNQDSYIRKGITNDFESYDQFRQHAHNNGYKLGFQCHRKDKDKPYNEENLEFLSVEDHRLITSKEKRKLSDEEVRIIRQKKDNGLSTWKIADQMNISQTLAWRVVNGRSYSDVQ